MHWILKSSARLWINGSAVTKLRHSTVLKRHCTTVVFSPDIEYDELQKKLVAGEITLIDVRQSQELIRSGRIPNAINVGLIGLGGTMLLPPEKFEARLGFKKPELDASIAVMCVGGVRSLTAQCALKGIGYTNVRNYLGSFEDWEQQGGDIEYTEEK